ncbi:5-demethoxyubiquinol-8 5-hydroxylase UbiM [Marinicella rhabdoformis]|uniref:5-demethoxyubiquinol-8 5-hydroxylase UbiM n=1 Tax=Marinicella rhabdoformis TaxID=2580566 RepID=UPI0012AEC07E|nr:5-demethoxyubiquinol-8 5-hydroxylase UbiM [Marinicella rhabdoformis]
MSFFVMEKDMTYDVVVIGAGPAGLSFAKALKGSGLKVLVIEQNQEQDIQSPAYDGREIALTHSSRTIMQALGQWDTIDQQNIGFIKEAKVSSGNAPLTLDFNSQDSGLDCLGFMVSNQNIRHACFAAVEPDEHVDFCFGQSVQSVKTSDNMAQVTLSDEQTLSTQLVVAADSRFSQSRRQMGISTDMVDFGRTCIVFTMTTEKPHNHVAHEMFRYDKTIAVLPLVDNQVSVVITIASDKADDIIQAPALALAAEISQSVDHQLGVMTVNSELYSYPLVATMASQYSAKRFALIGDAAVGMHPVTAHGFNLGLSSAWQLAKGIKKARQDNQPFYQDRVLRRYHHSHKRQSVPIYKGTNVVVKLFTKNQLWAKAARHAVLKVSKHVKPISQFITKQLTQEQI